MEKSKVYIRRYIQETKSLFPILRKEEREYLRKLKSNITNYDSEASVDSLGKLYEVFGNPSDTVHDYFSMIDISSVFSYIRIQKIIKGAVLVLTITCLLCLLIYSSFLYSEHKTFMREEAVFIEDTISD